MNEGQPLRNPVPVDVVTVVHLIHTDFIQKSLKKTRCTINKVLKQ